MTALSTGLRRVAERLAPDPAPDGELLARFLATRDETAFASLVRRHAAMVFGTCRRVLGNAADADDAFQAAFVVLVRKAHSLTARPCVGNFLYGVAFHTALKARAMATKRRAKEAKATRPEPAGDGELTRVLDEELARLPDKYREPVVLCELEGVPRREAAGRLGIPEGTISSRLATAHRMLAKRLAARGFAAVAVAAVLADQAVAVSETLTAAAVRAAVGGPPPAVTQLASEVSKMLLWNKLRAGAVLAGLVALLAFGVGVGAKAFADDKPVAKAPVPAKEAKKPDDAKLLQGKWVTKAVTFDPPVPVQPGETHTPAHHTLTFTDTELTWESYSPAPPPIPGRPIPRNVQTRPFKLDQTTSPKELTSGDTECVYELDGDTLKVAMYFLTPGRPKGFNAKDSPPGRGHVILIELTRQKEEPKKGDEPKAKPAEKKDEPAWKAEFRKTYGLKDGQLVRRVAPAYPDCRDDYFKDLFPNRQGNIPFGQWFAVLSWKGEWTQEGPGGYTMPVKPDEGITLERLLDKTLKVSGTRLEADLTTRGYKVTGDFVVRDGADPEKAAAELEAILRTECELPVKFSFRDSEEEVFVLGGKYAAKPLDRKKADEVEVYAVYRNDGKTGGGGSGTLKEMAAALERHVGKTVILGKVEGEPKRMSWHFNDRDKPFTRDEYAQDHDPATVLANIAEQTGLKLTTEKRKVRLSVVEHEPLKK